ncbi:leucyl/phenylalanyl-tRNA--protein transferase [Pedobacter puniceum]|uniref:Leucyl/phenylalanyl-tRNA--protein transferase n=1 Tax=Pedobacter puniceum TaxID=2666136 RepID=A0A7K0FQ64_9SPHI|nr:leucyl/phenylalanyl-tRNA--protein transferase [Pedobacter puniceum]MRX47605.1 leucyl/phenylalanyl-tRNA--protein transferase [Pedobacter puniceum]
MIFELSEDLVFPNPAYAEDDGLLALGGDLSVERLLLAYSNGIFPWFNDDTPILWYAPHQRFVLFPDEVKISKSMKQILKRQEFQISLNKAFADVITACATINRDGQDGTWITTDMQAAYIKLHEKGYAHAVEVWKDEKLVGGLYGVFINGVFCGESMFAHVSNASKAALIWLCQNLELKLIDCQVYTSHLESMGAKMIDRESYLKILQS